jgi:hypothetical protein
LDIARYLLLVKKKHSLFTSFHTSRLDLSLNYSLILYFVKVTYFNRLHLGRCQIYVDDPSGGQSGGIGVQGESCQYNAVRQPDVYVQASHHVLDSSETNVNPVNLASTQQPSNQNVDAQVRRTTDPLCCCGCVHSQRGHESKAYVQTQYAYVLD